jgi:hypothetical protein
MRLEQIAATNGFVDYWDYNTGYIYKLQSFELNGGIDRGEPVEVCDSQGNLIGRAEFSKELYEKFLDEEARCCP